MTLRTAFFILLLSSTAFARSPKHTKHKPEPAVPKYALVMTSQGKPVTLGLMANEHICAAVVKALSAYTPGVVYDCVRGK